MTVVFVGQTISQVKISGNAVVVGWGKCVGVETRNTHTRGAEAGLVNE